MRNSTSIILSPAEMIHNNRVQALLPGALSKEFAAAHPGDYFLLPARDVISSTRRLVLLIPDGVMETIELARFVTMLSAFKRVGILLVGVYGRLRQSRENVYWELTRLEPLVMANKLRTTSLHIEERELFTGWNNLFQAGDICLCFDKHKILRYGWLPTPIVSLISQKERIPIYVMTGFRGKIFHPASRIIKETLGWASALALIGANSLLLIKVFQETTGLNQIVLAMLAVTVTLGAMLLINKWTG